MKITIESDCAIRIILFLSMRGVGNKTGARMISENENIPIRFALKILRKLKLAGLICSFRGQSGGYALLMEPKNISLKNVIEIIDGKLKLNKCLNKEGKCDLNRTNICPTHFYLNELQEEVAAKLDSVSFQILIDKYEENQNNIVDKIKGLV